MTTLSGFLGEAGIQAVFLFAFVENMGLPIPALPVLILAGALSRAGGLAAGWALCGAALGAVIADVFWYQLGRWRGRKVLAAICRFSMRPEACVEAAEGRFHRHRFSTILLAKFVPGLNAVAPPLAGSSGMPLRQFLPVDAVGCVAWATVGIGSGWLLGAAAVRSIDMVRGYIGWLVFAGILAFFVWNGLSRVYLVRRFPVTRIPAAELQRKLARGENPFIIDLRSPDSYAASAATIPSAVRVEPGKFGLAAPALPRDRELIFYCA